MAEDEITQIIEDTEKTRLFYDKFAGKIPEKKLEIIIESHTHFSRIKKGCSRKGVKIGKAFCLKFLAHLGVGSPF